MPPAVDIRGVPAGTGDTMIPMDEMIGAVFLDAVDTVVEEGGAREGTEGVVEEGRS